MRGRKIVKLIIYIILLLFVLLTGLILSLKYITRMDTNGDGIKNLAASTNIRYLIRYRELDGDGKMDLKEYVSFRNTQVRKFKVLDDKFDRIEIIQSFCDKSSCIITANNECKQNKSKVKEIHIMNKGSLYYYTGTTCQNTN